MSFLGNVIWLVFGGFVVFLHYLVGGILMCLTIIGIPFGIQVIKMAQLSLWPFGKDIVDRGRGAGCLSLLMNILWLILGGFWIALHHLIWALILGVIGGAPPTVPTLLRMVETLPRESDWEVIGISLSQWRLVAGAISLGGNVRVGLEDNFYVSEGEMARSNGDLVDKAARMVRDQGREVATVEQCRERLGLTNR